MKIRGIYEQELLDEASVSVRRTTELLQLLENKAGLPAFADQLGEDWLIPAGLEDSVPNQ